jgi:MFS family permease
LRGVRVPRRRLRSASRPGRAASRATGGTIVGGTPRHAPARDPDLQARCVARGAGTRPLNVRVASYRATVAALAIGQLLCWAALYYAFSSFVIPMQRDTGWSSAQLMGAFTLGLTLWGAASYAVGAAIDRGRGRAVLTAGAALAGVGCIAWSQSAQLGTLYASFALLGVAMAMTLYEPAFSVLTKRFPDRFAAGITTLTLVGGFASTLAFPAAAWLIARFEWRGALLAIGAVLLFGVAPLHAWALRGTPVAAAAAPRIAAVPDDTTLREALSGRTFWLLTTAFTLYAFAAAAIWAHLMPALAAKGLSQAQALAVVVWFGPAQVAGRIAYLGFAHRLATRTLGLLVLSGLPLALAVFALSGQVASLLLFALLFGLANGLVTIVRGTLVPQTFGRAHLGRISGAMSGISLLARAAAPLAAAWLLLVLAGYRDLFLLLALFGVAAVAAFALARRPLHPRRDGVARTAAD